MWYPAKVTSETVTEPLTVAAVKKQFGVSAGDTSKDDDFTRLLAASRQFIEKYCGIFVPKQTVEAKCDHFSDFARLPLLPLQSVTAVSYTDPAGAPQTLPAAVYEYRADGLDASIALKFGQVWPSIQLGSRITVTADVGFDPVPGDLTSAMMLWIGGTYSSTRLDVALKSRSVVGVGSREWDTSGSAETAVQSSVYALLENYRCWASL